FFTALFRRLTFEKIPVGNDMILHSGQGGQYQHKQVPADAPKEGYPAKHKPERERSAQYFHGDRFWPAQKRIALPARI
ncbi:MAG: hypothetical protein PUE14_09305, partial [Clostridia bacterium]|nr:hypothetical protein [Clostridia bacterium]